MSGPCTLQYLLIGAVMARWARDVHEGIDEAQAERQRRDDQGVDDQRSQHERERAAIRHLARRIAQLEAGMHRTVAVADALRPTLETDQIPLDLALPAAPATRDAPSLEAYARQLEQSLASARAQLAAAGDRLAGSERAIVDPAMLEGLAQPKSLAELLEVFVETGRRQRSRELQSARRARIEKLLAPLRAADAVPPVVETLLRELAGAPDEQRAEALTLQLRHEVATERARRDASERQRRTADALLDELAELAPVDAGGARADPLRQTLELCAAGLVELDASLTQRARSLIAELRREAAEATRTAAAQILEGALKDLGFVVEPIAQTLFIEGGVAHFTRPEWGEYAVRLRGAPGDATLNFNVVREAGAADDGLSTRLRDGRAEEAWCAHIPALQDTLQARGIQLQVARLLGAGEAPAQVVPDGTLGALHRDTRAAPAQAAALRRIE